MIRTVLKPLCYTHQVKIIKISTEL